MITNGKKFFLEFGTLQFFLIIFFSQKEFFSWRKKFFLAVRKKFLLQEKEPYGKKKNECSQNQEKNSLH